MNNCKKIAAAALAVLMMLSIAACGEKNTDELGNTPDTIVSDGVEETDSTDQTDDEMLPHEFIAQFAHEQLGSNSVMFKEKLGRNFGAVSTGDNFGSNFNEEYLYGEMSYDDNAHGNYVTARMMRVSDDTKATDIFVNFRFLEWENAVDEIVYENVTAKVLRCTIDEGDVISACWIDNDAGFVYGIIVLGETLELEQYVSEIFYP